MNTIYGVSEDGVTMQLSGTAAVKLPKGFKEVPKAEHDKVADKIAAQILTQD